MNFFPFGRRTQTDPTPPCQPWLNSAASSSSSSFKDLGPSHAGHVNPYHLAPFPVAEEGDHPHRLVSTFIQKAYPRAPEAIPPNELWATEVETLKTLVGAELSEGATVTRHAIHGRILLARGEGVWIAGGKSERGVGDEGKRLALSLPLESASGASLEGHLELSATHWEYGCTLRSVEVGFSSPKAPITTPYISIWRCLSLGANKKPVLINLGDGIQSVGILVAFIMDPNARANRRARPNTQHHLYRPPSTKGSGVSSAMVELVKSALMALDVDGASPMALNFHFLDPRRRSRLGVSGQGANIFNGGWLKGSEHEQSVRSVFYGLPEGSGRNSCLVVLPLRVGGSGSSSSSPPQREKVVLTFASKVVSDNGLVTSVTWAVSPAEGASLLPRKLVNLEELVFSA